MSNNEWETPPDLFKKLDDEFGFIFDAAASDENALCFEYSTNSLDIEWKSDGPVWMNPPYSRDLLHKFVAKAHEEQKKGVTVVGLLPVFTSTKWFHEHIYEQPGVEIRFIKGRVQFYQDEVKAKNSPTFSSMIVIWKGL